MFQSWMMGKFRWYYFKLTWINTFYLTFGKDLKGGGGFTLIWEELEVQRENIFNLWDKIK